jgi:hypothetical protein
LSFLNSLAWYSTSRQARKEIRRREDRQRGVFVVVQVARDDGIKCISPKGNRCTRQSIQRPLVAARQT